MLRGRLFVAILALALLSGCGGAAAPQPNHTALPDQSALPQTVQQALAQLEALPVPAGADAAVFSDLKGAMRDILSNMDSTRFVSTPPTGSDNRIRDLSSGVDDNGQEGIQWNYRNVGDYNFDGLVSILDLSQIGIHFNKDESSADWLSNARFADGNEDGVVTIADLTPIGMHFLSQVAGYNIESASSVDGPWTLVGSSVFDSGTPLLTGIRMYHSGVADPALLYRVIPMDADGNPGDPSDPSSEFIVSEKARVVNAANGLTYLSHMPDRVMLQLADGVPSPIAPGDIIVGEEQGGYLMKAMSVEQTGNVLDIQTEPAVLTDVFLQGGLTEALDDISQVPPETYTLDLTGQVLCDVPGLFASVETGSVAFLPQADVAVNYNEFGGVTYLRGLVLGGPLDLDMTVTLSSSEWSGPFPPTPEETLFYEHKMTGFSFDFVAYQNGVPVTMALQYDVYVGIFGDGNLFGTYVATVDATYDNIKLGGVFDSSGITDFNEYSSVNNTVPAPIIIDGGGDFSFTAFVRPEIHIKLYGNPVPGNSEDLALKLRPGLTFAGSPGVSGEFTGYFVTVDSALDNSYLMSLTQIGMGTESVSKFFPGALVNVFDGFILPQSIPQ